MPLQFVDYPVELICRIFSCLDVLDLYHCSITCTLLRRVIEGSVELQLDMHMGLNRVVCFEPLASEPPLSARLELLKCREHAWRFLRWKDKIPFEFLDGISMYEYVGGVYSVGNFGSVSMIQLHSSSDGEQTALELSHIIDFPMCEYTTDSTQDLMILVEESSEESEFVFTSHIRTMSTNESHPRAGMSVHGSLSKSDVPFMPSWRHATVQISGDFVALLLRDVVDDTGAFIEIWNWTKATTQHRCELIELAGIDDMSFLSATTFLVTCPRHGFIEVYEFDDPAVSPYMTSKGRFGLPELQPGCMYSYVHANSYPVVGQAYTSNPIPLAEKPLFFPSPEERICVIHIPLVSELGHSVTSTLFIHSRVFFCQDPRVSEFCCESYTSSVPWKIWGPQNSRWHHADWSGWRYASCGLKVIDTMSQGTDLDSIVDEHTPTGRRLRLRDFNSYAFGSSTSDNDVTMEAWRRGRVESESSWMSAGRFFTQDVESFLPYREVVTEETFDLTEVMLDENQIVLLKRMGGHGLDQLTVLKFSG